MKSEIVRSSLEKSAEIYALKIRGNLKNARRIRTQVWGRFNCQIARFKYMYFAHFAHEHLFPILSACFDVGLAYPLQKRPVPQDISKEDFLKNIAPLFSDVREILLLQFLSFRARTAFRCVVFSSEQRSFFLIGKLGSRPLCM